MTSKTGVSISAHANIKRVQCSPTLGLRLRKLERQLIESANNPNGDVARDRLRFDALRWYLSKLAPKRYGDKVEVTHGVDENLAQRIENARSRAFTD